GASRYVCILSLLDFSWTSILCGSPKRSLKRAGYSIVKRRNEFQTSNPLREGDFLERARSCPLRKGEPNMKKHIVVLLIASCFAGTALAYGPRGHHLVGAIADKRLAKNAPVATKVNQLLDGLTLEAAATLADEIKSFDDCDRPPSTKPLNVSDRINRELRAFLQANPCSGN